MQENTLLKNNLDSMQIKFKMGGLAKCLSGWGFSDIQSQYNKLYYLLDGQMSVSINNQPFVAKKGDCVLLPCNITHSYACIGNAQPLLKYWVHFTANCNGTDLFQQIQLPNIIHIGYNEHCISQIKQLIDLWPKNDILSMFRQKFILFELITLYLSYSEKTIRYEAYDTRIQKAIEHIQQNISADFTGHQFGQMTGLHPNYFIRLFKSQLGITPVHYINKIRINKAKELLRTTDFPICEIASMIGMPNYSYFSRLFKEQVDFSPTEYRSLVQNEDKMNYPEAMQKKSILLTV